MKDKNVAIFITIWYLLLDWYKLYLMSRYWVIEDSTLTFGTALARPELDGVGMVTLAPTTLRVTDDVLKAGVAGVLTKSTQVLARACNIMLSQLLVRCSQGYCQQTTMECTKLFNSSQLRLVGKQVSLYRIIVYIKYSQSMIILLKLQQVIVGYKYNHWIYLLTGAA